jgi:hypothetical protein
MMLVALGRPFSRPCGIDGHAPNTRRSNARILSDCPAGTNHALASQISSAGQLQYPFRRRLGLALPLNFILRRAGWLLRFDPIHPPVRRVFFFNQHHFIL